jgi:hypothetical protein
MCFLFNSRCPWYKKFIKKISTPPLECPNLKIPLNVWTVWVDSVCDWHYCLYDSLYLFCLCLYCKIHLRCVLNDVSPYNAVKCPKYPRKERSSLEKNARGRETLQIQRTGDREVQIRWPNWFTYWRQESPWRNSSHKESTHTQGLLKPRRTLTFKSPTHCLRYTHYGYKRKNSPRTRTGIHKQDG